MTSCIRLSVRRNVDLPQPDGPMNAVTERGSTVMRDVLDRLEAAVVDVEVLDVDALGHECRVSLLLDASRTGRSAAAGEVEEQDEQDRA